MRKTWLAIFLLCFSIPAFAVGVTTVTLVMGASWVAANTVAAMAVAMAINMVVSMVVTKAFANDASFDTGAATSGQSPNPGSRQQVPPATDNKLPVVYGSAFLGGIITDLSITNDNQKLYYVISLCEVTNNGLDTITFGDTYFGGKKVLFGSGPNVVGLLDESTGVTDTKAAKYIKFYQYRNGSNTPVNSTTSAITLMSSDGLSYTWGPEKLMSNCAFVIMVLEYNASAGITGLQQTKFQVTNSRTSTGACFLDYFTNTVYGAAIPIEQINTASLDALTAYSDQAFTYTDYDNVTSTQPRFKFNGTLDTARTVMANLQDMASCCDCLIKYNEVTAKWGVIVQSPVYTPVMNINDSNMISAIKITPLDIAASYNVIECKFPDSSNQDAFNSATFDLSEIDPGLLYPNEPVNKLSLSLPLTNNSVTAQYIANRFLKAGREDLQIEVSVNFVGVQLDSGDVVTVTNANYGWTNKPFRINRVIQQFNDDGSISVQLSMSEYNASVYDDVSITEFAVADNSGLGDPLFFGTIPAPVILNSANSARELNPYFLVSVTTSSAGITQYAEVWYSAYANPTVEQLYFAGTSEIQSSGTPWGVNTVLPSITLINIPAGNWYVFSRMVNSLGSSSYSLPSALLQWRPSTFQFSEQYLTVAYADDINGGGFSLSPTNKEFYGLRNQTDTSSSLNPADYTWYLADPNFGTIFYLCYANRTGRKFSFDTGEATRIDTNATFIPVQTAYFDPTVWSALPDGVNFINLDVRTGQLIKYGGTTDGFASGELTISNNAEGKVTASLNPFLATQFGTGVYSVTSSAALITVDVYGRVVGFEPPDEFYYSEQLYVATSGQTVFSVTRGAGYIVGQCWVFKNGCWLEATEYTDAASTVTLDVGATAGDHIKVVSFKSSNSTTGVYASFTVNTVDLVNASSYTASGFTLTSGFEILFLNGTVINDQDYDIVDQTITNFPALTTGKLSVVQWTPNNLGSPNGSPVNVVSNTVVGQTTYLFSFNPLAFNLYQNGIDLVQGTDFTTASGAYTLANVPDTILNTMVNQTFARTGAV
jgi:hypothetical protein